MVIIATGWYYYIRTSRALFIRTKYDLSSRLESRVRIDPLFTLFAISTIARISYKVTLYYWDDCSVQVAPNEDLFNKFYFYYCH